MSSLVIDLILCGLAYIILIYFVATMSKNSFRKGNNRNDDGDGGVDNITPPKIDLPPGVIWPSDSPVKTNSPEPVEF
ncbi:MAG: hypothetical protein P8O16_01310 [Algoriphagus sp.]|jgi:hypothetical protein|uniref:hypothetical protein n=1 Tax=Algoriphagus sp. TaxID=1872435 RepID=UPI0026372330|nr:hypothetical protein [Algoriphagus sp.]MDG1275886.1 hypothetical protein [Algoriphagus sp.]